MNYRDFLSQFEMKFLLYNKLFLRFFTLTDYNYSHYNYKREYAIITSISNYIIEQSDDSNQQQWKIV